MNIYEQIDTIFSGESEEKPLWARELQEEMREIKKSLQQLIKYQENRKDLPNKHITNNIYYTFIKNFRASMSADMMSKESPTFEYLGRKLGINSSGLMYDKKDFTLLPKQEALEIYKYLYKHQNECKISA